MLARLCAFLIWALVAATTLFWGLRLFVRSPSAPPYAVAVDDTAAVRGDLTRLLGAAPPVGTGPVAIAPEASARFKLLGIMAPRANAADRQGVALIAVDGKPARAFTVGSRLDDDLVLQSVSLRAASIGPARGQSALTLEMPPLPTAAIGTLPPIGGVPVPMARMVPQFPPAGRPPQFQPVGQPPQFIVPPPAGGAVPSPSRNAPSSAQ